MKAKLTQREYPFGWMCRAFVKWMEEFIKVTFTICYLHLYTCYHFIIVIPINIFYYFISYYSCKWSLLFLSIRSAISFISAICVPFRSPRRKSVNSSEYPVFKNFFPKENMVKYWKLLNIFTNSSETKCVYDERKGINFVEMEWVVFLFFFIDFSFAIALFGGRCECKKVLPLLVVYF